MGYLSKYFEAIAVKRISAGEAGEGRCNQHEFNGVSELRQMFGSDRRTFKARFFYISENEDDYETADSTLTWYDARSNHPLRSEYRLYFSSTNVSSKFREKDLIIICRMQDDTVVVITVQKDSTPESQVLWLFGITMETTKTFVIRDISQQIKADYVTLFILEKLGIEVEESNENYLEVMLKQFGSNFPKSEDMSELARKLCRDINPVIEPDTAIIEWMQKEHVLFSTLERYIISAKLKEGFGKNEDATSEFLRFSLSAHNRRKSRAGYALENHLQAIFHSHDIKFSRGKITENRSKPDFIFPGIEYYHKSDFDCNLLTMLAAKTSCKDRWRQVLNESRKIKNKHLFTMEPAISVNQMKEMHASNLQLVIPQQLHKTFTFQQQKLLMNLEGFIAMVLDRHKIAGL